MSNFNLRVYGIILNSKNEVLVSDERRHGVSMTKFPGGGLMWGEGHKETLIREIKEEMNLDAEIGEFFYVNDFFQQSAYRENDQLFTFYYRVSKIDIDAIPVSAHAIPLTEEGEKFRWVPISDLNEDMFTFPIDKIVGSRLTHN
ncbi:MAG: NUDIX hydrolase [Crocinitomicaceae bacterium]|nr:NUDIX hydrolase [Crocinitomicaceae bacterium]